MPLSNPIDPRLLDLVQELSEDSDWQIASLQNGWINYGIGANSARFSKRSGVIYLQGLLNGNQSWDGTIFVLPEGFRPVKRAVFMAPTGGTNGEMILGRVDIFPDGSVYKIEGGWNYVSLDGLSFMLD